MMKTVRDMVVYVQLGLQGTEPAVLRLTVVSHRTAILMLIVSMMSLSENTDVSVEMDLWVFFFNCCLIYFECWSIIQSA